MHANMAMSDTHHKQELLREMVVTQQILAEVILIRVTPGGSVGKPASRLVPG